MTTHLRDKKGKYGGDLHGDVCLRGCYYKRDCRVRMERVEGKGELLGSSLVVGRETNNKQR